MKLPKYGNKKTNGYASRREFERALVLKAAAKAGEISDLCEQYEFTLLPAQYFQGKCVERACKYIADFVYADKDGNRVVEDAKGYREPVYRLKRKLLLWTHGIRIREV